MVLTATHSTVKIDLLSYTLRHKPFNDQTKYSSILTLNILSSIDGLFLGDTINFYADGVLVYSGLITELKSGQIIVLSTHFPSVYSATSNQVIFYNKDTIRVALDFNLKPFINFSTSTHSIVTDSVTHYQNYSEVLL